MKTVSKIRDLTNQKFGRLTARKMIGTAPGKGAIWRCECECGGIKDVPASRLINSETRSCGCLNKEIRERSNIAGERFGNLVAVRYDHTDEKYRQHWLFQCDCGNTKILPIASVKWNRVRSCGCLLEKHISELNKQDITGCRYDRLVAIRPTEARDGCGSIIWEFECDCGNIVRLSVNAFRNGRIHSCGCLYQETRSECVKARKDIRDGTSVSNLVHAKRPHANNTSGYAGVSLDKRTGRWVASINLRKTKYHLGSFKEKEDAIRTRKRAEEFLHDPVIMERIGDLTKETKTLFLAYLNEKENVHEESPTL